MLRAQHMLGPTHISPPATGAAAPGGRGAAWPAAASARTCAAPTSEDTPAATFPDVRIYQPPLRQRASGGFALRRPPQPPDRHQPPERGGAAGGTHAHEHGVSGARWAGTDIAGPASCTSCPAAQGACRTVPTLQGPRAACANRGSSCAANRDKKRFFLLTTIPPIQSASFGQRHQPRSDQGSEGLYFFPLGHACAEQQAGPERSKRAADSAHHHRAREGRVRSPSLNRRADGGAELRTTSPVLCWQRNRRCGV